MDRRAVRGHFSALIPITVVWGAVMAAAHDKGVNDLVNGQALAAFSP
jgi:hypothetical protein